MSLPSIVYCVRLALTDNRQHFQYIITHHLDDDDRPPMALPVNFRVNTPISIDEERSLGVTKEQTDAWRAEHEVDYSDAIEAAREDAVRKRGMSEVSRSSQLSTWSRQPSPSKVRRTQQP